MFARAGFPGLNLDAKLSQKRIIFLSEFFSISVGLSCSDAGWSVLIVSTIDSGHLDVGHDMEEGWEEAVLIGRLEAVDPHSNACPGRFSRASRASRASYALNANLVHKWLGDPRFVADCTANEDSAAETARFPPVEIEGVALSSALSQPAPSPSALDLTLSAQRVDLTLSDGRRILVEGTTALSAVLALVEGLAP